MILLSSSGQCFLRDNLLHQEVCCWDQKVDYIRVVSVALCYIIVRLGKLKNNVIRLERSDARMARKMCNIRQEDEITED